MQQLTPVRTGHREQLEKPRHVAVVGGGLAGVAAAIILAERGAKVTLVERETVLGGRVSGWTDQLKTGESYEMERGFHAFFRQYYNLRRLLRRIDPELRNLTPLEDYPIHGPGGSVETFRKLPKRAPFNVATLVMRTPHLKFSDLLRTNARAALTMLKYDAATTYGEYDSRTAREYLDSLNFPPHARRMLFDVFSHSFFNPEEEMSAGELLMMFHFYFLGNPEGLIFDVLNEPFSDGLWATFTRYMENMHIKIQLETEVEKLTRSKGGKWQVHLKGKKKNLAADAVVLAVTVPALQQIVAASIGLKDDAWRDSIKQLQLTWPFAVWRIWLDKEARPGRHPFVGTAGLGMIDNISLYELFEGESRRWVMRNGGSIVEIHAYAVPPEKSEKEIKEFFLKRLHELYPETKDANILEERFLWRQDCPAFGPGSYASRPTVQTPFDGLTLAGDLVRLPIPSALMEKAVTSGMMAANHLLADWDVRGETLYSIPLRGIMAGFGSQKQLTS